jgi:hypothetical protein
MPFSAVNASASRPSWVLWLALWLALFGALAPTVSHALNWAHGDRQPLVEICTNAGPRQMALSTPSDAVPSDPAGAVVLDHCPFCLLMADRLTPPSQPQALFFAAPGPAVVPDCHPPSHLPARIIAAAHPRGPPAP